MNNIINRLPDDIITDILKRLPEAVFANPNLSNRKAIQYGLLSKAFYEAFKKRSMFYFDASDTSTPKMEKMHVKERLLYCRRDLKNFRNCETFIFTFEQKNYDLNSYSLIDRVVRYCRSLKTINLSNLDGGQVSLTEPAFFRVPTLEQLDLKGFRLYPNKYGIEWPNLKRLCLDSISMDWTLFMDMMSSSPSLENLVIRSYKEPWKKPGFKVPGFMNLRTLHLDKCEGFDDDFFTEFGRQFPQLEELCLQENPNSRISVKSRSLKKIRLVNMLLLKEASFKVPNVAQFEFEGNYKTRSGKSSILPKVSVETRSEGWTSVIKLVGSKAILTQQLEQFKLGLKGSKISVHLTS